MNERSPYVSSMFFFLVGAATGAGRVERGFIGFARL